MDSHKERKLKGTEREALSQQALRFRTAPGSGSGSGSGEGQAQAQAQRKQALSADTKQPNRTAKTNNGCWERAASGCARLSRWMQDGCYQIMAMTVWDSIVSGFKPGRIRAVQLMEIKPADRILLVGEGSGLDFECLPAHVNKRTLRAFDFSSEMVKQSKVKAKQLGIPEENCFQGDAQAMPFKDERFDKIYFPLSVASIPDPRRALQEAERVLALGGKIVVFDKLMDDDVAISRTRRCVNLIASCVFADITRNLKTILGKETPLTIQHYESMAGKLEGCFAKPVGKYYKVVVLVRKSDLIQGLPASQLQLKEGAPLLLGADRAPRPEQRAFSASGAYTSL